MCNGFHIKARVHFAALAVCVLATGCTTIKLENAQVSQTWYPGFAVLNISPSTTASTVVRAAGAGLVFGMRGFTLGAMRETTFLVPDGLGCRVFLLLDSSTNPELALQLVEAIRNDNRFCVRNEGGN